MFGTKRNLVIGALAAVLAGAVLVARPAVVHRPAAESLHQREAPLIPVIAYLPDYRLAAIDPSVCSSLTDLIFFSIEPKPTGALDLAHLRPEAVTQLREWKQRYHLRLLVSLGGWTRSKGFGPMATDDKARGRFVQELTRLCRDNPFDGADFDWEHPANAAEEDAYAMLLTETKQAFQPHGLLLTVTLAAWQKLRKDGYEAVDRVHLMAYDHDGRHSTFEDSRADVDRLASQGVPRNKICLGVPFYGRNVTKPDQTMTYAEIINRYHPAPEVDEVDGMYFNGIQTIQQKTRYVRESHLGGLMIWELGQDTTDDTSLLRAIHQVVSK
jgi:GH18 family chitinase